MKSDFMVKTAKIIAEIRNRTCVDDDVEVIKEILHDALHECYDEGYDDGYAACKSILEGDVANAYDDGYSLGYDDGYSLGYDDGHSKGHSGV